MTYFDNEIDGYYPQKNYVIVGYFCLLASAVSVISLIAWLV